MLRHGTLRIATGSSRMCRNNCKGLGDKPEVFDVRKGMLSREPQGQTTQDERVISKINKGDKFICIRYVPDEGSQIPPLEVGTVYQSAHAWSIYINDRDFDVDNGVGLAAFNEDFIPYTKEALHTHVNSLPIPERMVFYPLMKQFSIDEKAPIRVTVYDAELSEAADSFLANVHAEDASEALYKGRELTEEERVNIWRDSEDAIAKEPATNQFQQIADSIADLLAYKNEKYGNSALNPLNVFTGKSKVGQRLDDKLSRIQNSDVVRKNDLVDCIGYMILVCKENNWTTFDEFKD